MKASETAGLLGVGSRGLGGFAGRMLGSVSSALPDQTDAADHRQRGYRLK